MKLYPRKKDIFNALGDTLSYTQENSIQTILFAVVIFLTFFSDFSLLFVKVFWLVALTVDVFLITSCRSRRHIRLFKSTLISYVKKTFILLTVFQLAFLFLYPTPGEDSVTLNTQHHFHSSNNSYTADKNASSTQVNSIEETESTLLSEVITFGLAEGAGNFSIILLTLLMGLLGYPLKLLFFRASRSYYALLVSSLFCGVLSWASFQWLTGLTFLIGWPVIHTVLFIFLVNLMIGMLGLPRKPRKKKVKKGAKERASSAKPVHSSA